MGYGRTLPDGFLPVYSVADEREAERLVVLTCPLDYQGQHFARELVEERTLESLDRFSDRLDEAHDRLIESGSCRCRRE